MKVLMTTDTVGGVWTYAMELTRALPDVTFTLATMGRRASNAQRADVPPNVTLAESDYKLEWQDDPWRDVAAAGEWLLALEAAVAPDVVHLNGYVHGVVPFRAPKIVVAHSCVLSWWRAVKQEAAPPEWEPYREAVTRGLDAANLVVAPSSWMLRELARHYQFDTPSKVIDNGRTFAASHAPHRHTVFAAGRMWDEAKNLAAVVAAAPGIAWPVHIAGDGGTWSENVTYRGTLAAEGMAEAYGSAGVYLFPALYEPFGLSILEAALSGCALVIGDIPSLRELWQDAALFVPPREVDAIAAAVNEVIQNEPLRRRLANAARARATRFTPARMANGYQRIYEQLTGTTGAATHAAHDTPQPQGHEARTVTVGSEYEVVGDRKTGARDPRRELRDSETRPVFHGRDLLVILSREDGEGSLATGETRGTPPNEPAAEERPTTPPRGHVARSVTFGDGFDSDHRSRA